MLLYASAVCQIDRMEGFLNQVNSALAHLEQVEMLHDIMSKLDGYSGIEIPAEYEKVCSYVVGWRNGILYVG